MPLSHFADPFLSTLQSATRANARDDPNYYVRTPRELLSTSTVQSFYTGTGSALYNSLAPLLESTSQELILVTCFWARSSSLDTLSSILLQLSEKSILRGEGKIRVRLCFSSLSIFQKLFHNQSVQGQDYPPDVWTKKLGLPKPEQLSGLDLKIKSVFLLPFSVMHPKFMIIDRKTVVLPSCNISWEEWFEGAITFSGPIVGQFLKFYEQFWDRKMLPALPLATLEGGNGAVGNVDDGTNDLGHGHIATRFSNTKDVTTVFLPSPHRRNPCIRPFTHSDKIVAPPSPLNAFVLTLFAKAERSIRIQTPNVTSPPVLSALLKALARGIDVRILTSERLMIPEQLVTAGTTTYRCIKKLIKRYKALSLPTPGRPASDEEAAISTPRPGRLHISFFEPIGGPRNRGQEGGEPQQSHLKMTIVDEEVLVLGSGNLDRASWFTSQELGVAFFEKSLVEKVEGVIDEAMRGRSRVVFDSHV